MGKVIQGIIFLALIGGVIVGAKIYVLDPMKKDQELQEAKKNVTNLVTAGKYQEAATACDTIAENYPKQKTYAKKRKFDIYIQWAEKSHDEGMDYSNKKARAKRQNNTADYEKYSKLLKESAQNCLTAVAGADENGQIMKVHQQWRSIAYGHLGQKKKAIEAMKRQAELE